MLSVLSREWFRSVITPSPTRRSRSRRGNCKIEAFEYRVLLSAVDTSGVIWNSAGPGVIQNGQSEGIAAQNNPVSGAVHAVVAHPTNPDILWIGATNGGIWKTTNATSVTPIWTPLTDETKSLSTSALVLDPTDPTSNTLVAGIGRYSSFAEDGGARTGLLKTTDGGTTWTALDGGGVLKGKNISGIAARGNTIVVSVNVADSYTYGNIGIFRSIDGGATFTQVSSSGSGLPGGVTYDLATDPSNSNVLYTGVVFSDNNGGPNGIYKSTNLGATWSKVSSPAMDAMITNATNNIEFSVGTNNNVYVGITTNGQLAGLFRSGNGGATFAALDTPRTNENGTFVGINPEPEGPGPGATPQEIAGGQGSIHFSIVADPTNANMVYVGGDRQVSQLDSFGEETGNFPNSLGANNYSGRLFRVNAALPLGSQASSLTHQIGVSTTTNSAPHADSRDMTIDSLGRIIEVDDGGIYRRTNPAGLGDWTGLHGQSLQNTEFHSLTYDSLSNVIFGGAQDVGTSVQQVSGSQIYREDFQGDGGVVSVDNVTLAGSGQSIRYVSFQYFGAFTREVWNSAGTLVSSNSPALTVVGTGQNIFQHDSSIQFYQPIELNTITPSRGVLGTNNLYETTDQFGTLRQLVTGTSTITSMAYGGLGNADAIYYGNAAGQLFVRSTALGGFTQLTAYTGQAVNDIVLDSSNWRTAFIADSNQVFRTTNAGATISDITGNLTALIGSSQIRSVTFLTGQNNVGGVLVGTDIGTYISTSMAYGTWQIYGANLPNAPAMDVRYNAADDLLTVGTLGRGAWTVAHASQTFGLADFGDLPDSFGTTLASDGARHLVGSGLFLGAGLTSELDGQPSPTASLDSDDGVSLPSTLVLDTPTRFVVTASQAGMLDAFLDFNGDGTFDSNERITPAGGRAVTAGANNLDFNVPSFTAVGQRAVRFRISSAGGLGSTGLAADGEVEDYFVNVVSTSSTFDFGDLPNTFGTTLASNGARHQTGGGLFLGSGVTSEADGQPSALANADIDDGVTLPASLKAGTSAQLTVRASQAGKLDAFIDFNGNGVFDANERVTPAGGLSVTAGVNNVTVTVPANAVAGQRGARFRLSSAGGLAATGLATDGEVEDYFVTVVGTGPTFDFGDLPDTFGTTLANNGARHQTGGGLFLGSGVTSEADGQPSAAANADSDDGVFLPAFAEINQTSPVIVVTASQAGKLDVFIDYNANGIFDTGERVTPAGGLALTAGSNSITFNVPESAIVGGQAIRFRLSSVGGLAATGAAADGEVEDYRINITSIGNFDYGDLPDSFSTTFLNFGPHHGVGSGLFLGAGVSIDTDGKPSPLANLDDKDDGVVAPATLTPGTTAVFSVTASKAGKLNAFIDFNGNGRFDFNEQVTPAAGLSLNAGVNAVSVNVPANAVAGQRGARFRLSTDGFLDYSSFAADGEVEDYFVTVSSTAATYDFGDLPNTFGTTLASNGARHQTGGSLFLGTGVTSEADGQPSALANADSDDGVTVPATLTSGTSAQFTVKASQAGKLDAFIDFNGNGVFDANERVTPVGGLAVVAGLNNVTVSVPANAVVGQRGARFRLSTAGGLAATGLATDGEVEDYFANVVTAGPTYDFGDLPDTFGTLLASNGPRHLLGSGLFLGTGVTSEADGKPSAAANLDADDGVTAPATLAPRVNAQFSLRASQAGKLDAFIDFNGNGVFDTNERVTPVGGLALIAGLNTVNVTVPDTAVVGQRGARFRISTAGGLAATGQAADGEVEDYFVNVVRYDFGDLPNTFGTTLASNGARHQVGGGLFLGTSVTSELDGQPSATASLDSDDGVIAPATLTPRVSASFSVTASRAGKLDAFIDFNGNGVFDANERVTPAGGLAVTAGLNNVAFTVPDTAVAGQRGARFRLSTAGGLAATGLASDGEVEDYFVNVVRSDFGDLPNSFGTTLASNGARHQTGGGLFLGAGVTSEADGQPSALANLDSDDGVTIPAVLTPQLGSQFSVTASRAGKLDAFIDFNGNGVFDSNERVTPAGGLAVTAGVNTVTVNVPANAVAGQRGARFRLSTAGGLAAVGLAADGEVEDYFVRVVTTDYGDLPDSFGTTLASDGARHLTGGGLFLGAGVTSEPDGQPSAAANLDSDDGVTFSPAWLPKFGAQVNVTASQAGKLDAFIDFNGNGTFEANERVTPVGGLSLVAGASSFVVNVPEDAVAGARAARFRLSSAGGLSPKGVAADGEVEDYLVNIVSPAQGTVQLLPDPENAGRNLIYINGTNGNDTISVSKADTGYVVRMNNVNSPILDATSRIVIYGLAGNDKIALPTTILLPGYVDGGNDNDTIWGGNGADLLLGGNGNDTIYARGNTDVVFGGMGEDTIIGDAGAHLMFGEDGNDNITGHGVLVGGAGDDTLNARGTRNVLIGGAGVDNLNAATKGDILIGGATDFDTNRTALLAILTEWSDSTAVNTRIAHLTGALPGGANGPYFLVSDAVRPGTVHDDLAIDTISNTFAEDWLLVFPNDNRKNLVGIVNHS